MIPQHTSQTTTTALSVARAEVLRQALEAKDQERYTALFAEEVLFYSPIEAEPMQGRQMVSLVLSTVVEMFEDFHYTAQYVGRADSEVQHVLHFTARVGDTMLEGVDLVRFDEAGQVSEFKVLLRPFAALELLHRQMGARLGPPPA